MKYLAVTGIFLAMVSLAAIYEWATKAFTGDKSPDDAKAWLRYCPNCAIPMTEREKRGRVFLVCDKCGCHTFLRKAR